MSTLFHFRLTISLVVFILTFAAKAELMPTGLVLPVLKDVSTKQYLTNINQRTPSVTVKTTLDLGGQYFWTDCGQGYISSSFKPASCNSPECDIAGSSACITQCYSPSRPGCVNNTCGIRTNNPITASTTLSSLGRETVSLSSTDGSNPGMVVSISNILFGCAPSSLAKGLSQGAQGIGGLGRANASLPFQFSSALGIPKKFALCLPSTENTTGVAFFGDGPYNFLPNIAGTDYFTYSPLIRNPVSTAEAFFRGDASSDYFLKVQSIQINGKAVKIKKSLLTVNEYGRGGMKLSTLVPYTVLHTSIHRALIKAFAKSLSVVPRVPPVAPFELCFNSTYIDMTRLGPGVPEIGFVLHNERTVWRMFGGNTMVEVAKDVLCLGFVNGGRRTRTSIVIGGYQMENNLLQFDLDSSRFGFSSFLFPLRTSCGKFNFTTKA